MDAPRPVAAAFDERAGTYARHQWHRRYAELLVDQASLRTGQHVLDAGVGTGFAAVAIARAVGPGGRVVGVDVSRGMLDQARRTLNAAGLGWVELFERDATDLHDARDGTSTRSSAPRMPTCPHTALVEWRQDADAGGIVAFRHAAGVDARRGAFRECAEPSAGSSTIPARRSDAECVPLRTRACGFAESASCPAPRS